MIQQLLVGLLILGVGISAGVAADTNQIGSGTYQNGTGQEIVMAEEPAVPEIPPIPAYIEEALDKAEPVNGRYNVSRSMEISDEEGGYAFAQLDIVNATSWGYGIVWGNSTDSCFVTLYVMTTDAEKVLFRGHAISPDNHIAYGGIGMMDEDWKDADPYNGFAKLTFVVNGNDTSAQTDVRKENGTITHLTRAYHVIGNSSSAVVTSRDVPGLEWNPDQQVTPTAAELIYYDQYAGSFLNITSGTVNRYQSSASSGPDGASSRHDLDGGKSRFLTVDTQAEEWPVGHTRGEGKLAFEYYTAKQVNAFSHTGYSWFNQSSNQAFGKTESSADDLEYILISAPDGEDMHKYTYSKGAMQGGTGTPSRLDVPTPATFSGWIQAEELNNISRNSESYTMNGAYIERMNTGGTFDNSTTPASGVLTNISIGMQGTPPGASKLQGSAVLTMNNAESKPTTLDGRWVASTPPGIRTSRYIEAQNSNNNAFSDSSTISGYRYIKESAYSRPDMADAQ